MISSLENDLKVLKGKKQKSRGRKNGYEHQQVDTMFKHFKLNPEEIKKEHKDIIDTLKTKHLNPRTAK